LFFLKSENNKNSIKTMWKSTKQILIIAWCLVVHIPAHMHYCIGEVYDVCWVVSYLLRFFLLLIVRWDGTKGEGHMFTSEFNIGFSAELTG
jgi:hypothetical protein